MSRRTQAKPVYKDSDSSGADTDNEEPTPKLQRTHSRKRVSDVYEQSFTSDQSRQPLKPVNINDDAAEKRRRRKSAKLPDPGPPTDPNTDDRENMRGAAIAKQKQLASVAEAPAINVPLDVMSSNFEEWMKMATDNKINAANSWNFALIDYFHDMSLLRNNTDNSINFQRASCTLDGCVKIWTSRVDSVGTETGKLLSNLANEGRVGDDGEDGIDEEGGEGGEGAEKRKKKAHRPGSTLAKDMAQLRSKKLDLEFHVDPLFKKTCADFDEGGAQGLLMNHLALGVGTDGSLRVVFDASDSRGKDDEDESQFEEPPSEIDLSYLRQQFLPNFEDLEEKEICYSLSDFSFSKDAFAFNEPLFRENTPFTNYDNPQPGPNDEDGDDGYENEPFNDHDMDAFGDPVKMDGDTGADAQVEDFFVGDQAVGDDYVPDANSPEAFNDHEAQQPFESDGQGVGGGPPGAFVPFDPRRAPDERGLVMAMTDTDGEGVMMDYFDQTFLKNWAGPEHWKLRKVVRKPETADAAPKARKERKEAFKIDFLTPSDKDPKEIAKELFAPVTRGAGITLPPSTFGKSNTKRGTKRKKGKDKGKEGEEGGKDKRYDQTLPDDMHFSSRQLVTLFLKPKFSLRMQGQKGRLDDREGEIDEGFWAQVAANQAAGHTAGDETADPSGIPFNTQFFQDDYDDGGGFDDDGDDGLALGISSAHPIEPGEQDLLAATQGQTRRVRPEFVNYAKRAKRVDVRKLKDNIWHGLDIIVPERRLDTDGDEEEMDTDVDGRPATDPDDARTFENVISGLQRSYPREKMEEISTSFCFICLLHLANERGLKLEGGGSEMDGMDGDIDGLGKLEEEDRGIGNIWDLKVYRDPDAIPSA